MVERRLSLYLHLPWCEAKCPYCDFNSYTYDGKLPEDTYTAALIADFASEWDRLGPFHIDTIFIGGGTPSLFDARQIARLLDAVKNHAAIGETTEVTLESNPGSAEISRFAAYREAGVNRLSIGVQSFNNQSLLRIGRVHDASQAHAAIAAARAAGFDNLNLDLMFGLPGAAEGDMLQDIDQAIAYGPEHISWYELTLEPGTAFAAKPPQLPSHDNVVAAYDQGVARLASAGYHQYEISAYAVSGHACRHNLNYWRYGDYLGIGAGAHSKITFGGEIERAWRHRNPRRYMSSMRSARTACERTTVEPGDRLSDYMINALRLRDGFSLADCQRQIGESAQALLTAQLEQGIARGWLERDDDLIRPTATGFRYLNDLQLLFVGGS